MSNVWLSDGSITPSEYIYIGMLFNLHKVKVTSEGGEDTIVSTAGDGLSEHESRRICSGFLGSAQVEWLFGNMTDVDEEGVIFSVPLIDNTIEGITNEGVGGLLLDNAILIEVKIGGELQQYVGKYEDYGKLMSHLQKYNIFMLHKGWEKQKVKVTAYLDSFDELKRDKITVLQCCPNEYYTYD